MHQGWVVRAGQGAAAIHSFLERGIVALGGEELGDLSRCDSSEIRQRYDVAFPKDSRSTRITRASQIARFLLNFQPGDGVVTPSPGSTAYLVGVIVSGYLWQPDAIAGMPHTRRVEWSCVAPRRDLTEPTRNTLGSISALFSVPEEVVVELRQHGTTLDAGGASLLGAPSP
jgi:predicted Mrr-cat superfamily restriction endonuclease